jgi:hypothetical protein
MTIENTCTASAEPHANKDVNEVFNALLAKLRVMSESEAESASPSFKIEGSEVVLFRERPHSDSIGMYIRRPGHANIRAFFFPDETTVELEVTIGSKLKMLRVPMKGSVLGLVGELVAQSISAVTAYNLQHKAEAAAEPKPPLSAHEFMAALHTVFDKHEIVDVGLGRSTRLSHMHVDVHPPCRDIFFGFEIQRTDSLWRRLGSDYMLRGTPTKYVLDSRDSHNHNLLTFDRPTESRDVVKPALDILTAIAALESKVSSMRYVVRRKQAQATSAAEPQADTNSFAGLWLALTDMVPSRAEYLAKHGGRVGDAPAVFIEDKSPVGLFGNAITISAPTCHAHIALPHKARDQFYRQMQRLQPADRSRKNPKVALTFFSAPMPQDNDIDAYRALPRPEQILYDITSFSSARDALRAILRDFVRLQRKMQAQTVSAAAEPQRDYDDSHNLLSENSRRADGRSLRVGTVVVKFTGGYIHSTTEPQKRTPRWIVDVTSPGRRKFSAYNLEIGSFDGSWCYALYRYGTKDRLVHWPVHGPEAPRNIEDLLRRVLAFVTYWVGASRVRAAAEPQVAPGGLRTLFHSMIALLLAKKHLETESASIDFSRGSAMSSRELVITVVLKHKTVPVACRYFATSEAPDRTPAVTVRSMNPGYLYEGQWFRRGAAIQPKIAAIESATTVNDLAKSILDVVVRDAAKRRITPADAMQNLVDRALALPGNKLETQTAAFVIETLVEASIQLKTVAGVWTKTSVYTEVSNDQLFVHFGDQKREITKVLPVQELADEIERVARELTGIKAPGRAQAAAEPAADTAPADTWVKFYEWVGEHGRKVGNVALSQDRQLRTITHDRIIAKRDGVAGIVWYVTYMPDFVHVVKIVDGPLSSKTYENIQNLNDFRELAKRVVAFVSKDDLEMEPVGPENVYIEYVKARLEHPVVSVRGETQFKLEPEYKHSEPTDTVLIVRDMEGRVLGRLRKARNPIRIVLEAYTGNGLKTVDHTRPNRTAELVTWLEGGLVKIAQAKRRSDARRAKGLS